MDIGIEEVVMLQSTREMFRHVGRMDFSLYPHAGSWDFYLGRGQRDGVRFQDVQSCPCTVWTGLPATI